MNNLSVPIRRHPVAAFYILAFVLSWLGWFLQMLYARGLFPFDHPLFALLGGVGPTLAAVIVTLVSRERDGMRRLFGPLFLFRASFWWFIFVFGFWIAVTVLVLAIGIILGRMAPALGQFAWVGLLPVFITMLFSNVWEEIGWRGFALSRLQANYGDLKIVLVMGLLWSLWHLPLLLNPASPMSKLPWYGEVIFSLSLTTIYTWLYQNTARSLFFVSVFHAMSNTMAFVLVQLGVFTSSYLLVVGATTIVAIVIVLVCGSQRFTWPSTQKAANVG